MNLIKTDFGVSVALSGEPLPIRHIVGIGRNYMEHAKEQGAAVPTRPMTFSKNPASLCLNNDTIVVPKICQDREQVDFEGELGFIIGWKECWTKPTFSKADFVRDVPLESALKCVLGYVVANDVSARWWQKDGAGGQFNRGKGFDTFCPIGPTVVAAKEIYSRRMLRLDAQYGATALKAEAWHHRSDALTSAAAFIGIAIGVIGGPGYEAADDWAALLACALIAANGVGIARAALGEIMDTVVPPETEAEIRRLAGGVPGVRYVEKCRVRRSGLSLLVDIHVHVDGALSVREGHAIAHAVQDALVAAPLAIGDVAVHIEPARAIGG